MIKNKNIYVHIKNRTMLKQYIKFMNKELPVLAIVFIVVTFATKAYKFKEILYAYLGLFLYYFIKTICLLIAQSYLKKVLKENSRKDFKEINLRG